MIRHPPITTLFPYTTLFRSLADAAPGGWPVRVPAAQRESARPVRGRARRDRPLGGVRHRRGTRSRRRDRVPRDRKSTRLNSSHSQISYAVFCLKKKKQYMQYSCQKTILTFKITPTCSIPVALLSEIRRHLSNYTAYRRVLHSVTYTACIQSTQL